MSWKKTRFLEVQYRFPLYNYVLNVYQTFGLLHCITSNSEWPWNFYTDKKETMRILYFYFAFSIVIVDVRFVMIYSMLIFNIFSVISLDIIITTYSSTLVCHLVYF